MMTRKIIAAESKISKSQIQTLREIVTIIAYSYKKFTSKQSLLPGLKDKAYIQHNKLDQ